MKTQSPLRMFLRPLAIMESRTTKFVCNDVFRSAIDVADLISLIHTTASIGPLTHEDSSLLKFLKSGPFQTQLFGLPFFFWNVVSLSLHSFWLLSKNIRTFCGGPDVSKTRSSVRTVEMETQTLLQSTSVPPLQFICWHKCPFLHHL